MIEGMGRVAHNGEDRRSGGDGRATEVALPLVMRCCMTSLPSEPPDNDYALNAPWPLAASGYDGLFEFALDRG